MNLDKTLPDGIDNIIPYGLGNGKYLKQSFGVHWKKTSADKINQEVKNTMEIKDLEQKLTKVEAELAETKKREVEAKAREKDWNEKITKVEAERDELKKKLEKEAASKKEDAVKTLRDTNEKLEKEVAELKEELKKYSDYEEVKAELEKEKKAKAEVEKELTQAKADIEEKGKVERLDARMKEVKEIGLDFSEDHLQKIEAKVKDLEDDAFKVYLEELYDTALATIKPEVAEIIKKIKEKEADISFGEAIEKAYAEYNEAKKNGDDDDTPPPDLKNTDKKSLGTLGQNNKKNAKKWEEV